MAERVTMDAPAAISFSGRGDVARSGRRCCWNAGLTRTRGLTVTEEDLDGIVARFSGDGAPVKVEHMDTPLDPLGRVQKVWRDGSVLMAKLLFPAGHGVVSAAARGAEACRWA